MIYIHFKNVYSQPVLGCRLTVDTSFKCLTGRNNVLGDGFVDGGRLGELLLSFDDDADDTGICFEGEFLGETLGDTLGEIRGEFLEAIELDELALKLAPSIREELRE